MLVEVFTVFAVATTTLIVVVEAHPETQLIFSHALGLQSLNLTSLLAQDLYANGHSIFDLDLLWNEKDPVLYWSDYQDGRVYSASLKNGALYDAKVVVSHGVISVEGIAIDWIAQNLYLVESKYGWIEVTDLRHKWRSVLITNIDAPRALALDSRDGFLFWTDRSENKPKIERSTMAGTNRKQIVDISSLNDGGLPNGLTIDYSNRRLYWIDAKSDTIYSATYDGDDLQHHFYDLNFIQSPFGLSFYDNYLYFVDAKLNTINKIDIHNESSTEVIYKTYHSLYGVIAVHENHHPKIDSNPCSTMGCSHLCLLIDTEKAVCRCPQLMMLSADEKHCQRVEDMILVSEFHEEGNDGFSVILGLSGSNVVHPLTVPIVPPSHTDIVGLELDGGSGYIYWADATTNTVWKASILGKDLSKELHLGNGKVTGFGVNWKNSTMYYSSVGKAKGIFSCAINSNTCVSIIDDLYEPRLLTLHPILNKIFWIEKKPDKLHIASSNLDGTNCTTFYDTNDVHQFDFLKSFTLDLFGTDLYWIDSRENEILRYDMKSVETLAKFNSSIEIITLFVDKERILVSDSSGKIHELNKADGKYMGIIYISTGAIKSLRPVQTSRIASNIVNPCYFEDGGCTGGCTYNANGDFSCRSWSTTISDNLLSTNTCHLICKNGGQCQISEFGNFFCNCTQGYYGVICQRFNENVGLNEKNQSLCKGKNCASSACYSFCQHGRCHFNDDKQQRCVCNNGWSGSTCNISTSEEIQNMSCPYLCFNQGKCEADVLGIITCSCQHGYSGDRCEIVSSIDGICWALIFVSAGWIGTILYLVFTSTCLSKILLKGRSAYYKPKHHLLVDYNSNGPPDSGAVYSVLSTPQVPRHSSIFHQTRVEDDMKLLTEADELNRSRNWKDKDTLL